MAYKSARERYANTGAPIKTTNSGGKMLRKATPIAKSTVGTKKATPIAKSAVKGATTSGVRKATPIAKIGGSSGMKMSKKATPTNGGMKMSKKATPITKTGTKTYEERRGRSGGGNGRR